MRCVILSSGKIPRQTPEYNRQVQSLYLLHLKGRSLRDLLSEWTIARTIGSRQRLLLCARIILHPKAWPASKRQHCSIADSLSRVKRDKARILSEIPTV